MKKSKDKTHQRRAAAKDGELGVIRAKAAAIDIGSRFMHVCGPVGEDGEREVRMFETTTAAVKSCAQWLSEMKVESVALESTGVYWVPVLEILESCKLEVVLTDTRPVSRVVGRKSDVLDCEWSQTLHSHGLLKGSFVPGEQITQLRNLVRQKAVLGAQQADWTRRMHKCLDQMNIRVHHAVSDTQGTTGMAIIRAIVNGERDPKRLAALRDPRCHKSEDQIAAYLTGHFRADHLFNLQQNLKMYDSIGERMAEYEKQIQERMKLLTPAENEQRQAPALKNREKVKAMKRRNQEDKRQALYRMAGADLTTIDGIGVETAEVILSEYGMDLSRFEDEKAFVQHLKLAPFRPVSGGKVLKNKRAKNKRTRSGEALQTAAVVLGRSASALGA